MRPARFLIDALAPPFCVLCGRPPGSLPWLCAECSRRLELHSGVICLRCGAPRPLPAPLCAVCPDWPRRFAALRSAAPHRGAARDLVNALNYGGRIAAARPLGSLAAAAARRLPLPAGSVVVAVPLHGRRRRRRGFHPADEIARVVARELGLARRPRYLRRIRDSSDAVHRTPGGRMRETRGAFRAKPEVRGQSVLLVDDVVRTGATIGACARALFRRGAAAVWAATATRLP